jgi:hypothetical protein
MAYFLKHGSCFRVETKESMDLHDKLPAGNYVVQIDPFKNFYLEKVASFELPEKCYGDLHKNTSRILQTYESRPVSTGVMLNGEKGSGKTLLSKNIAVTMAAQGHPTIIVNQPFHGDAFNKLLQDIEQPCMILFDEFEKVYGSGRHSDDSMPVARGMPSTSSPQEDILTLLDGVFGSKKLYMFTCNDKWKIDSHMRNRPGRIFYMIDFSGLAADFIEEYCNDNLKNKQHIPAICSISALFGEFNFDMLKALVEEMNRYDETPQEALRLLNAKPEYSSDRQYSVAIEVGGKAIKEEMIHPRVFKGNPLNMRGIEVMYTVEAVPHEDPELAEDRDHVSLEFQANSLVKVDAREGRFVFQDKGTKLILTKVKEESFSFKSSYAF